MEQGLKYSILALNLVLLPSSFDQGMGEGLRSSVVAINKMELLPWPLGGLEVATRPALALCSRGGRIQYHPSVVT